MTSHVPGSIEHLTQLTLEALDSFEDADLAASTRRALRIARLRGDADHAWMLARDLHPGGGSSEVRRSEVRLLWPDEDFEDAWQHHRQLVEEWIAERSPRIPPALEDRMPTEVVIGGSIQEIEARRTTFIRARDRETDIGLLLQLESRLAVEDEVLGRIRSRVFSYLCQCEQVLALGGGAASIFDRYRSRVDAQLAQVAPDVLEQLNAAYRRTREGDPEARSHALTSCRRMLKSVADVVFPPSDQPFRGRDGREHEVGSEQYLARIWAFLDTRTGPGGTVRRLTTASLVDLGGRVDRLYDLTCRGVHAEVTQEEVDLCVLHSFLIAGEVLRLHSLANTT